MENGLILARNALNMVLISMPHLAGLVASVRVQTDDRVATAGVFASGRLLINPYWFGGLTLQEATFVMAHELMHLIFRTHERGEGGGSQLVNVAHDLVINQALENDLGIKTPAGGLTFNNVLDLKDRKIFKQLRGDESLEEVYAFLKKKLSEELLEKLQHKISWQQHPSENSESGSEIARQLSELMTGKQAGDNQQVAILSDVLSKEAEQHLFPNENIYDLEREEAAIEKKAWEAISTQQVAAAVFQIYSAYPKGASPGSGKYTFKALHTHYAPPWEWAMQQWLEETGPPMRTYARPSRRGAEYTDFVRPGKRSTEALTLNIILDTSGSMRQVLPRALGIIGSFCEAMDIGQVRIIQSDTQVTADERVNAVDLKQYEIKGMGGSDMTEAMLLLAKDDSVERVIVLTDGYINFPEGPMPYEVLWTLMDERDSFRMGFDPGYGRVIEIRNEKK